ncbi:hypothetical protein [Pseudomonas sp. MWU12-2345]|uniref:hypothetical protein n=1 Tax=Pseudomonas sp. MWU12-2345 TaxID=2928689 RepID=UPI002010960C|nr:hypothetical protein [Pseudomonas sp. MWU12-2345]
MHRFGSSARSQAPLSAEKASKRTIGLDAPDDFGHTFERPITDTKVIEDLYCADFAHLQDVYNRINQVDVDENPV